MERRSWCTWRKSISLRETWCMNRHPWMLLSAKCGQESKVEEPELLRSTKLRKQVSTLCQLLDLSEQELEQVATFMGHGIRVHRDLYRQTALCTGTLAGKPQHPPGVCMQGSWPGVSCSISCLCISRMAISELKPPRLTLVAIFVICKIHYRWAALISFSGKLPLLFSSVHVMQHVYGVILIPNSFCTSHIIFHQITSLVFDLCYLDSWTINITGGTPEKQRSQRGGGGYVCRNNGVFTPDASKFWRASRLHVKSMQSCVEAA